MKIFQKHLLEEEKNPICVVFNTACFGDVLVCNSLCQNIKRINPDSKIVFVTDKPFVDVAKYQKDVDEVIVYDKRGKNKGFKGLINFVREFPYKKPFVSFVTYQNLRNCIASKMLGSKFIIEGESLDKSKLSTQEQHTNLLKKITKKSIENLPVEYIVNDDIPENLKKVINRNDKYIGLCTLTKNTSKNIPIETAINFIKKINSVGEYKVLFFGVGQESEQYASKLTEEGCNFINLVNKTTIYELAQILKLCKLLVSADTGTMHLGYSVKTPVVAVFYEKITLYTWIPDSKLYKSVTLSSNQTVENILAACNYLLNKERKVTVVIPTLQKNKEMLINLLETLNQDDSVNEIILIDNSLKGLDYTNPKLKLLTPKENLFVNPSWNLGVKEAKNDIVALLNDDIIITNNFCSRVVAQINPNMGCIGFNIDNICDTKDEKALLQNSELVLEETKFRGNYWGIVIFFYKSSYVEIPKGLKIFCGDDWIFLQNKICNRKNYTISGQNIYHHGSLSSASKSLGPIGKKDRRLYRKLTRKWWQYVFNIEPVNRGIRLTVLGIELLYHTNKNH